MGWLTAQQASSLTPFLDALRAGLADYGYQEGRNLTVDYRFADDVFERVPALADELVRLRVDLIVAQARPCSRSAIATCRSRSSTP